MQVPAISLRDSVGVSFELMLARKLREDRRYKKAKKRYREHEQQQRQRIVGACHVGPDAQTRVKPDLRREPAQQGEAGQAHGKHRNNAFDDVLVLEVTKLVRQHGIYFTRVELLEQGVVKHHAFGRAKTGEIGIGMRRALAAVHDKKALGRKAATLHQRRHAGLERFIVEWFEFVEQGRNDSRVEHQHQQVETHPAAPGPQPPPASGAAHQPQNQCNHGQANDGAHHQTLGHVGQPQLEGHLVEAKALFNAEGAVQRKRQVQHTADEAKSRQQRQLRPETAIGIETGCNNRTV